MKTITKQEFNNQGLEWTKLDDDYDNLFQDFLNNPRVLSESELVQFKAMQQRLYALELYLYQVAEGEMVIGNE